LTSVIASASIQWAMNGKARTTVSQDSTSSNLRSAASLELVTTPPPHVPLSAGSVRATPDPSCCSKPPNAGGTDPSALRKWRP
jgi:hypothetical protein